MKKPNRTNSLRTRSGKKPGGQKGHQGYTLEAISAPDNIVTHQTECCFECGCRFGSEDVVKVIKRQVFDIPEPKLEVTAEGGDSQAPEFNSGERVTEHQVWVKECPRCHQTSPGNFPETVKAPVRYGERIRAVCAYLHHQHFLPEERLSELLWDIFGCAMSGKTIANISTSVGELITPTVEKLMEKVKEAPVKHLDETGLRIEGKTNWLHVVSTEELSWYRTDSQRKDLEPLCDLRGTVIHDHWKSYVERGLRYHQSLPALARKNNRGRIKRRVGHNLLLRLRDYAEDVWRFLTPGVPFTNNQAERDLRMIKCKQKISGGFRTGESAENFAKIRSVISTARKQGRNLLQVLTQVLRGEVIIFS